METSSSPQNKLLSTIHNLLAGRWQGQPFEVSQAQLVTWAERDAGELENVVRTLIGWGVMRPVAGTSGQTFEILNPFLPLTPPRQLIEGFCRRWFGESSNKAVPKQTLAGALRPRGGVWPLESEAVQAALRALQAEGWLEYTGTEEEYIRMKHG